MGFTVAILNQTLKTQKMLKENVCKFLIKP